MESKRIEAESATLVEMQENLRAGKKPLSVAYEENKILQADLLREGESIEKKTGATSCLQRARRKFGISNNKELNLWRGTASKRLAWMDERRIDRGDRSGSEEEKTPRDD